MQRLLSRVILTAGFVLLAVLASVGSSSGVSANLPYPDCGPAIPCGNHYGYAPSAYYNYSAPYSTYRTPSYAYPSVAYAPTYFYDGVTVSADVFTRNGCTPGNYTCLRNNGVRMSSPYAPYRYVFGYLAR